MEGEELELRRWADAVERLIAERPCCFVRRVVVLAETRSTQDAALAMCGGEGGLLVLAGRQTAGRGRLGRSWVHLEGLGVAAKLTLRAARGQQSLISLAVGVAAAAAVEAALPEPASRRVGVRWPNDVVEWERGRKLAGVLIEAHGMEDAPLLVAGIGINVLQTESDWPEGLAGRAASVRELGSTAGRAEVIVALVDRLEDALQDVISGDSGTARLIERWRARDVLRGTTAEFVRAGIGYRGVVESIDPTHGLGVRLEDGSLVHLPAADTTLRPA